MTSSSMGVSTRRALGIVFGITLLLPPLLSASASPQSPRSTAANAPIIENERVTVWEIVWNPGAPPPAQHADEDHVVVYLAPKAGEVSFRPKGTPLLDPELAKGQTVRAHVIALHNHQVAPLQEKSSFPAAFPRPGSRQLLDNPRVVVWDYSWIADKPTPMHFHDKDVVVVYMADGTLKSTTPDGQSQSTETSMGLTKFNARNRTHTELLVRGTARVIAVELK